MCLKRERLTELCNDVWDILRREKRESIQKQMVEKVLWDPNAICVGYKQGSASGKGTALHNPCNEPGAVQECSSVCAAPQPFVFCLHIPTPVMAPKSSNGYKKTVFRLCFFPLSL